MKKLHQVPPGHSRPSGERYVDDLKSPIYYLAGLPDIVSAMRTLLKDLGVIEDGIRAEEFSGFKMDHTSRGITKDVK